MTRWLVTNHARLFWVVFGCVSLALAVDSLLDIWRLT